MKQKLPWSGMAAGLGMLLLILDGKTALAGAQQGLQLCISTVIPALFPFLTLSAMLMGASFPFLAPLGRILGIPKGAEALILPAFLGGYPLGAQSVAAAFRSGQLRKREAERLLAFCNNAGPAFLFGMVSTLFPSPGAAWALWGVHVTAALLTARLFSGRPEIVSSLPAGNPVSFPDALQSALRVMGMICGWVVLFRVVIAFLDRWVLWLLPSQWQAAVTGLLELTNGCIDLRRVEDLRTRFLLCSGLLAAGGLCVTMQTVSVTKGLSLRFYFLGKAAQIAFSLLLCGCILGRVQLILLPFPMILALFLVQKRKRGSIFKAAAI